MSSQPQQFKLLLVGDSGVGKSSILLRFTDDQFEDDMSATIGVDFKVKFLLTGGTRVKLTIWDTAGQERFRTLTSAYYRNAHGIILVYDVTNPDSFAHLEQWLGEVDMYSSYVDVVKLLVANKTDLLPNSPTGTTVPREKAEEFARKHGMVFVTCSAKTREGVQQAFEEVVQKILERPSLIASGAAKPTTTTISDIEQPAGDGACAC